MASQSHAALSRRLHGAALSYHALGYSVIPVLGDAAPDSPKRSAVNWKPFQRQRAAPEQLEYWFSRRGFQGLAIVTGAISRLAVLDFDDAALAKRFESRCPDLVKTRTIRSAGRGLPHYYYEIPPGIPLESVHLPGLDLQYNGRYVLTAPTVIAGSAYEIARGGQPKRLTIGEIRALQAFFDEVRQVTREHPETPQKPQELQSTPEPIHVSPHITPQDAVALYQQRAGLRGRNNALFQVACQLRDAHWTQDAVATLLSPLHVAYPASSQHAPETPKQRHQEAQTTIASAFTRLLRKPRQLSRSRPLPNSLREHLLQQGKTALARVLDGLLLAGVREGQKVSEKFMRIALEGRIGRHSIRKALAEIDPSGAAIFVKNPSPRPPTLTAVAAANAEESNNPCELFRVTEPDKNRGRPTTYYVVPQIDALCERFGLQRTGGDDLHREDVNSVRKYRQALHRELIRRRPGQYSGNWLAARLGLSKRSIQRYRQDVPLKQRPMYHTTWITWQTLEKLPHEADVEGAFLQDATGKRYPATQAIARRLLGRGLSIAYQRQTSNYYWHQETTIDPQIIYPDVPESPKNGSNPRFKPLKVLGDESGSNSAENGQNREIAAAVGQASQNNVFESAEFTAPLNAKPVEPPRPHRARGRRYYRQPLPEPAQEQMALRLYEKVLKKSRGEKDRLSKARSRRLVEQYGMQSVNRLIQLLTWRDNIDNPAGFSIIYLRSESLHVNP